MLLTENILKNIIQLENVHFVNLESYILLNLKDLKKYIYYALYVKHDVLIVILAHRRLIIGIKRFTDESRKLVIVAKSRTRGE